MDLSILIVTYNSARLIGSLLDRLRAELAELDAEVVIVDNASHDGSLEHIQRWCQGELAAEGGIPELARLTSPRVPKPPWKRARPKWSESKELPNTRLMAAHGPP